MALTGEYRPGFSSPPPNEDVRTNKLRWML